MGGFCCSRIKFPAADLSQGKEREQVFFKCCNVPIIFNILGASGCLVQKMVFQHFNIIFKLAYFNNKAVIMNSRISVSVLFHMVQFGSSIHYEM